MTKHGDSPIANGDRPALTSEVSEFCESFDRIAGELSQSFERSKNALTLKGLSFCEAYIEGRARIAVKFRANSAIEAAGGSLFSIWAYKGHRSEERRVGKECESTFGSVWSHDM